jgi:hypothetical protein
MNSEGEKSQTLNTTNEIDDYDIITEEEVKKSKKEFETIRKRCYIAEQTFDSSKLEIIEKTKASVWSSLTSKLVNLKNSIKFNLVTTNTYLNLKAVPYIRLFEKVYTDLDIKHGLLDKGLHTVLQFTYRSNFTPIVYNGGTYITDCGWGCMIRAAQMMLAKGILEKKLYDNKAFDSNDIADELLIKHKINTLLLLFDNNLSVSDVSGNEDFFNMLLKQESVEKISNEEDCGEYHSSLIIDKLSFAPPFSIQNICKLGPYYDKGPGIWFSDVNMCNIFAELNYKFKAIDMEFFTYTDGVVYETEILDRCFEEVTCDCINIEPTSLQSYINNLFEDSICNKCLVTHSKYELYKYKDKYYRFKKGGFIFVSVRLGLDNISQEYSTSILNVFKIPNNLGLIGGRQNSAHYFIGESCGKLIYLDPHVNQYASKDKYSLEHYDLDSYKPVYIYKTDVSSISPGFTAAFYFRDLREYKQLIEGFINHSSLSYPVFKFRHQEKNSLAKYNVKDIIVEEDFCIVKYD